MGLQNLLTTAQKQGEESNWPRNMCRVTFGLVHDNKSQQETVLVVLSPKLAHKGRSTPSHQSATDDVSNLMRILVRM